MPRPRAGRSVHPLTQKEAAVLVQGALGTQVGEARPGPGCAPFVSEGMLAQRRVTWGVSSSTAFGVVSDSAFQTIND